MCKWGIPPGDLYCGKVQLKESPNMSDVSGNSKSAPEQDLQSGAPYKKGDFIGQKYEVYRILDKGGCGVVYLVYSHELGEVYALKTFLDKYLANQEIRKRFHKEASVWVELGRHPYLVHAYFVDEISGRFYISMEYITPNRDQLNSLDGYLQRQPPDLVQTLRWAIQICHGMEYAYSKGLRAHRDLKPANIMITQDKTAKITVFGLAGVLSESLATRFAGLSTQTGEIQPIWTDDARNRVWHSYPHGPGAVRQCGRPRRAQRHLQLRDRALPDGGGRAVTVPCPHGRGLLAGDAAASP